MGENSRIEWTHHTFNPWHGCVKVSDGCKNCYAETLSRRWGHDVWGVDTPRQMMSASYWKQPLKWHRDAQAANERRRVFCASMADWAEIHRDPDVNKQLNQARQSLGGLIVLTPWLDWLLLTKRIENAGQMLLEMFGEALPPNVWLGTSVEDQKSADERIPHLLQVPAAVRFLSCEPLLGQVYLRMTISFIGGSVERCDWSRGLHWVIVGGESGANARPMHPDWARSLRDQCVSEGVAFHFKQWGEYAPINYDTPMPAGGVMMRRLVGLRADGTHVHPEDSISGASFMWRAGKKTAGRLLDGREWNEFPQPQAA